jgi:hypothetical protein
MKSYSQFIAEAQNAHGKKLGKASVEELHYRHETIDSRIDSPNEDAEFKSFLSNPRRGRLHSHPRVLWHMKDLHDIHSHEKEPYNRRAAKSLSQDLEGHL